MVQPGVLYFLPRWKKEGLKIHLFLIFHGLAGDGGNGQYDTYPGSTLNWIIQIYITSKFSIHEILSPLISKLKSCNSLYWTPLRGLNTKIQSTCIYVKEDLEIWDD